MLTGGAGPGRNVIASARASAFLLQQKVGGQEARSMVQAENERFYTSLQSKNDWSGGFEERGKGKRRSFG